MRSLKLTQSKPSSPASPSARQAAAAAVDADPLTRADRLFGAPAHLVLPRDTGPALSFMGWTIGSSRAESVDEETRDLRAVEVEIMFSEGGDYVVFERAETRDAEGTTEFNSSVAEFAGPGDVCRYCETSTLDPQADAARAAAVDHAAHQWHWLKRPGRRGSGGRESVELPFSL